MWIIKERSNSFAASAYDLPCLEVRGQTPSVGMAWGWRALCVPLLGGLCCVLLLMFSAQHSRRHSWGVPSLSLPVPPLFVSLGGG